ncbi:MAG: hypothetical protein ACREAC_21095, partial [Blastocatellia bacterium]
MKQMIPPPGHRVTVPQRERGRELLELEGESLALRPAEPGVSSPEPNRNRTRLRYLFDSSHHGG